MHEKKKYLGNIKYWLLASRPKTLPAAISPVLVGIGIAIGIGGFRLLPALAAVFCAVMIQIGANLTNDVADFEHGTDTEARLGPMRVTQAGLLSPRQVWHGVILIFSLAAFGGVYLAFVAGWTVIWIGLASIAAGLLYTVGPYPMVNIGLGDLFVMIFFGFVAVCGTVFVQLGSIPQIAWLAALGVGALTTNILVINNLRDMDTDRVAGRKNIPVLLGRKAGEWEFVLMLVISYFAIVMALLLKLSSWWVLLPLATLPMGWRLFSDLRAASEGPVFNLLLARTAQMLLIYSILLAIGLSGGRLI
jgi:1,4-dihydroxy-2-naphthoate polyprenyltransferase